MAKQRLPRPVSLRTAALLVALTLICGLGLGLMLGTTHPSLVSRPTPTAPSEALPDAPPSVAGQPNTFAVFWEAWRIIHETFLDPALLDDRRLTHGAIRGLLQSLADPNTSFQTPEERRIETPGYSGRLAGIGVYVEVRDGRVAVSTPIDDTPASRAGIQSGDVILAVDGQSVAAWALPDIVLRIRGPAGSVYWPLAVLLDGGTASAAEVFAAAIRDAGRAPLIGQRTYGKATIQYLHELSDGSGLHVTTARWVSPAGTRLDQGGLTPDIPVDAPRTDAADPALEQAIQHLHQLLPIPAEPTRAHQPGSAAVAGLR